MKKFICNENSSCFYKGPFQISGEGIMPVEASGIGEDVIKGNIYYGQFYGENLINSEKLPEGYMFISCEDKDYPPHTKLKGLYPVNIFTQLS